jgi:ribose transport system ATP-binding protein
MENIAMPNWRSLGSGSRIEWRAVRDLAERVIERYRIKCSDSGQKVAQLSGGNQQKIAISKWSELPLSGLLVEEPTRGVDVGARPEIYAALRQHADRGGYCILTSSDPGEIASLADRVIVMRNGRAVSQLRRPDITEASLMAAAL